MSSTGSWVTIVWIGLGGGLGAAVRGASLMAFGDRPVVLHAINITGCLLAGFALARLDASNAEAWMRPLVVTGFLGGLTTMSAFATQAIGAGDERRLGASLLTALVVVGVCLLAAAVGGRLGR